MAESAHGAFGKHFLVPGAGLSGIKGPDPGTSLNTHEKDQMGNHSQEHHVFDGDLNDALGVGGGCLPRGVRKSLRPHLDFPCCLKLSRDVSCGASRASEEQTNPAFAPRSTEGPWARKV